GTRSRWPGSASACPPDPPEHPLRARGALLSWFRAASVGDLPVPHKPVIRITGLGEGGAEAGRDGLRRFVEEVAGHPGQVDAHGLDGAVGVPGAQRGYQLPVVGLIGLLPLPRRAAPLEVAPEAAVPGLLDDGV